MKKKANNTKNVENKLEEKVERKEKKYANCFNNNLKEFINFYKENIRKKHIIIYIISLIIFFVTIATSLNSITPEQIAVNNISESINLADNNILKAIFTEKLPLVSVIVFAGITPFVYIPVLGIFTSYSYAINLVNTVYYSNNTNGVLMALGFIIQIFGIAMSIAIGIYYCGLSSKKFRYTQATGYSINDIKKSFYMATKKDKKIKEINKKIENKNKAREKFNVKIPYKMLVISSFVSFVIVMIGTIITEGV